MQGRNQKFASRACLLAKKFLTVMNYFLDLYPPPDIFFVQRGCLGIQDTPWLRPCRHDNGYVRLTQPNIFSNPFSFVRLRDHHQTHFLVEISIRSDQSVLHSQQPFDDRTSYRTDYVPHPQQERFQRKREEYIPNLSALYSLITDREDFI